MASGYVFVFFGDVFLVAEINTLLDVLTGNEMKWNEKKGWSLTFVYCCLRGHAVILGNGFTISRIPV